MVKIGKRGQQKAVKTLIKHLAKVQKLDGATFSLYFARNRKTRVTHPMLELQILNNSVGDLCACILYDKKGRAVWRGIAKHGFNDRLHRITAKMAGLTPSTLWSKQLVPHNTKLSDPYYDYFTEPQPRKRKMTVKEAQFLTAKATKNSAILQLRKYLHAVEKPYQTVLLTQRKQ